LAGKMLQDVRWRLVVPVGLGIAVLTFLLAYLIDFLWSQGQILFGLPIPFDSFMRFPRFMGTYAIPALHFLLTFLGAAWIARRTGEGKVHRA
jgi:hypothetical protein